jgi:hypothetical protein
MTNEESLQAFKERERRFVIDESQEELGQRNESDEDYNRIKILQRELGGLSVIGSLTRVQYGKWQNDPACLVSMRFQFQKGNAELFRFEKVNILMEFTSRPKGHPDADPIILNYGPKLLQSKETPEDRTWHYLVTLSAKATVGPTEIGPQVETGTEGKFTRHYAASVVANDWGNRAHRRPNCVRLWFSEDKRQEKGIPPELYVTTIVTCPGPIQATVQVHADYIFHLLAWPWSADDPILLQPGVTYGKKIREGDFDFSDLTSDEWRRMVTPDLEQRFVCLLQA